MAADKEGLRALNLEMNTAENAGDRNFLAAVLAPELAFSRANGVVDDADRFLVKVSQKPMPGELKFEKIETFGNRAIVQCVVTQNGKGYHNIRLFVRMEGSWKLLGWANESIENS